MFEYGEKVKSVVNDAEGTVIGFMRSRISADYDKFLVKFSNGEEWLRADCLESAEEHVYVPNGDRFKPYAERSVAEVRKGTNDRDNT